MADRKFLTGQTLFAFARRRAIELGISREGLKMYELIRKIQVREGHRPCFRDEDRCDQLNCCWQASCGAVMKAAD